MQDRVAHQRAEVAQDARVQMVGMSKEQVLAKSEMPSTPSTTASPSITKEVLDFVDPLRMVGQLGAAGRNPGFEYRFRHSGYLRNVHYRFQLGL